MTIADRRPRLVLILLCLALYLPGLFALPPTDRDESRFVLATRQMLESGDYVRIMNGAVPRDKKPIGIYWLQVPFVAVARATGLATENPVWPYRLPSLLGAMLAVLATEAAGRALLRDRRAALLAGVMLASCVILTTEAHIAKTDAALLGATAVAMAVLARAWGEDIAAGEAALFWVALGTGILIKGPITPMVVGLTAIVASVAVRRGGWLLRLRPAWGVPLLVAIVLPWFVAIGVATHGDFFAKAVGGDLARKLAGGEESHGAPPGLHALLLPLLSFPATMPVLCGLAAAWARRREAPVIFLLAWLVPAWLVFEAVPTKLPHYTLPLYPALCLLAADTLARPFAARRVRVLARFLLLVAATLLAGAALGAPFVLRAPFWLGVPAALLVLPVTVLAWRGAVPAAALAAVPLYAAILGFELPRLDALWLAPRTASALRAAWPTVPADGAGIIAVGDAEPSLMFTLGPKLRFLPTGALAARACVGAPHGAALVASPEVGSFQREAARLQCTYVHATTLRGFDYARGKWIELALFVR